MISNLRINRQIAKNPSRMDESKKTVSSEAMQAEWVVIQAAQKDSAKFRSLYDKYYEPIFLYVFKRTADRSLAGDICSKIFLKALQRLGQYQFKGVPFSAWLYRIASNEIAQHYRDTQKNRVVSVDETHFQDLIQEIDDHDHPNYRQVLLEALDSLKESDIQLIELRFFEQRPFKEIAEIMSITESNAKIKTYRILDRLRKYIMEKSEDGRPR